MFMLLSLLLVLPAPGAQPAELAQIQAVYLLPMGNGLDQYLANQLTHLGPFRVVTDPAKADAIFTDQLGEVFENRFNELYPAPAAAEKKAQKTPADQEKGEAQVQPERPVQFSSWGKGKGNIFIVNTRTRAVIWSAYERPRNTLPDELNRTAERIARRLNSGLKGK